MWLRILLLSNYNNNVVFTHQLSKLDDMLEGIFMSGNSVTVFNVSHLLGRGLAYPAMFYFHFKLMTVTYCLFVDVLNGYNGTIFAYGQTASGKTHTIEVCLISTSFQSITSLAASCSMKSITCYQLRDFQIKHRFEIIQSNLHLAVNNMRNSLCKLGRSLMSDILSH